MRLSGGFARARATRLHPWRNSISACLKFRQHPCLPVPSAGIRRPNPCQRIPAGSFTIVRAVELFSSHSQVIAAYSARTGRIRVRRYKKLGSRETTRLHPWRNSISACLKFRQHPCLPVPSAGIRRPNPCQRIPAGSFTIVRAVELFSSHSQVIAAYWRHGDRRPSLLHPRARYPPRRGRARRMARVARLRATSATRAVCRLHRLCVYPVDSLALGRRDFIHGGIASRHA